MLAGLAMFEKRYPEERLHGGFRAIIDAIPSHARVLDVACGSGTLMAALEAKGCSVVGIDIAPAAVALARSRGLDVHCGDVDQFERDEAVGRLLLGSYDAVVFSKALSHLGAKNRLLPRLRTRRILIFQRNPRYWRITLPRFRPSNKHPYIAADGSEVRYTMSGLRRWAESYGFEMELLKGGYLRGRNMVVELVRAD